MTLFIVGTGPGRMDHMSRHAIKVIKSVACVAGYTPYIELISALTRGKQIISTDMMKEVERVEKAIDCALQGKSCALISGGDPGIYAMAGLVFEICRERNITLYRFDTRMQASSKKDDLAIEIIPGIPALAAGAALLGAPLTHDFAAISLSDLLTPWEKIETRLELAAKADFVIVLYNPKSKKRDWQLKKAQQIVLKHRPEDTPVGIVTRAMRNNQQVTFSSLEKLNNAAVDMQTIIFIGSGTSIQYLDFLFTPRGYAEKYNI